MPAAAAAPSSQMSRTRNGTGVVNTNLTGTFYVSRAVWPHLVAAGGGTVVHMSSLAAQRGFSSRMQDEFGTTSASYYAAKAGVDALTRYMAGTGGRHNIRVNCVRPGQILTPVPRAARLRMRTAATMYSSACSSSPRSCKAGLSGGRCQSRVVSGLRRVTIRQWRDHQCRRRRGGEALEHRVAMVAAARHRCAAPRSADGCCGAMLIICLSRGDRSS